MGQVLSSGKDYIDTDLSVTICSYDLMGRKVDDLKKADFQTIIFDESHLLKCKFLHYPSVEMKNLIISDN